MNYNITLRQNILQPIAAFGAAADDDDDDDDDDVYDDVYAKVRRDA